MKCIIAGSRDITDYAILEQALTFFPWYGNITEIVSGCAKGVDALGEQYAESRGLPVAKFPAQWDTYGKKAGHLRNKDMAKYADIAIVIMKNGGSKGSRNMAENMRKLGKPCLLLELDFRGDLNVSN